jgi:hypothetical protein
MHTYPLLHFSLNEKAELYTALLVRLNEMERDDVYTRLCERERERNLSSVFGGLPHMTIEVLKQACKLFPSIFL